VTELAHAIDVLPSNQQGPSALPDDALIELTRMVSSIDDGIRVLEGPDLCYPAKFILKFSGREIPKPLSEYSDEELRELLIAAVEELSVVNACGLMVVYNLIDAIGRARAQLRGRQGRFGAFQRDTKQAS